MKNIKEFILRAKDHGLDGIVATDHHSYNISAAFEEYREFARENELYLFRGSEVTTDIGHLLVYGVRDDSWNTWRPGSRLLYGKKIIEKLSSKGVFVAAAHPYISKGIMAYIDEKELWKLKGLAALEVFNGRVDFDRNQKALMLYKRCRRLKAIGGSDTHNERLVGMAYTVFEKKIETLDQLVHELKYGYYYPKLRNCKKLMYYNF